MSARHKAVCKIVIVANQIQAMQAVKDYYQALGLSEDVSQEEIKKAYRKLARKYHPDRNPGDATAEERFKEIQEANAVLSDPEQRKKYDRLRSGGFGAGPGGGPKEGYYRAPDGRYVRFGGMEGGLEDIFGGGSIGDIFGGMFGGEGQFSSGPRARTAAGQDVTTTLRLPFDRALHGGKTEIRLPDGQGIRINIPKGVESGFKIRLKGRGQSAVPGGPRGDSYVTFEVEAHPDFDRSGNDLLHDLEITPFEAILGGTRNVTNPYGKTVRVSIPEGAQPGDKLRLKGLGVQTEKETGDLYVVIKVRIPRNLSAEQKKMLREVAREGGWI